MAGTVTSIKAPQQKEVRVPETPAELQRVPLVANLRGFGWISNRVASLCEDKAPIGGGFYLFPVLCASACCCFC
jgi:hypothetical protein